MPYIITTKVAAGSAKFYPPPIASVPTSRTAVATLEEAREAALSAASRPDVIGAAVDGVTYSRVMQLPESGGTIGPLPDGTVIAVRATDWIELAGLAGWTLDRMTRERLRGRTRQTDRDALLAAFNA